MITADNILSLREKITQTRPLIHCITNPVAANFCANALLALGAKPIMAEFAEEMSEITGAAAALSVNLGGINESKTAAILKAAETAHKCTIPWCIDLVGAACSSYRLNFASELIHKYPPSVIKGNFSETAALCGIEHHAEGVGSEECGDISRYAQIIGKTAARFSSVIMMTGETDLITDGKRFAYVKNGNPMMTLVTGTGCVLGSLTGGFLSVSPPFEASICAAVTMGIAGEYAAGQGSVGSFGSHIIDKIYSIDSNDYNICMRYTENEA